MNERKYIEVIDYDSGKHCLIKSKYLLGDVFTNIREIKWNFQEKVDLYFDIKLMKKVEALLGDKTKVQNKKIKSNEKAELIKVLYNNLPKPKENTFKNNIKNDNIPNSLKIDYYCLQSIVNIILLMLDSVFCRTDYAIVINEVLDNNFRYIMDVPYWGKSIMRFKDEFNEIETLTFSLSIAHDEEINLNYTFYFFIFIGFFLKK